MDSNYKTIPLFPSIVHRIEIDNFDDYKDQIIKDIYYEKDNDPEGRKLSNIGGWQSESVYVENCKSRFIQKIMIESLTNFKPMSNKTSMFVEGWTNINEPGNLNVKHVHPRCHLSGVLWIKTPKNCGNILFETPKFFEQYQELKSYTDEFRLKTNSYENYFFYPKEGKILIFPSSLNHLVEKNESDEDRISYSFNLVLKHEE